jgi:hypothetical protein
MSVPQVIHAPNGCPAAAVVILHDRRTAGRLPAVLRVSPWSKCAPACFLREKENFGFLGVILGGPPGGLRPGRRVGHAVHHPDGPRSFQDCPRLYRAVPMAGELLCPAAVSRRSGRAGPGSSRPFLWSWWLNCSRRENPALFRAVPVAQGNELVTKP